MTPFTTIVESDPSMDSATLILVCGHAIFNGVNDRCQQYNGSFAMTEAAATPGSPLPQQICKHAGPCNNPYDESQWLLKSFQKGESRHFIRHVNLGLSQLYWCLFGEDSDHHPKDTLLCFSGGATARDSTSRTEAEGYARIAYELLFRGIESERWTPAQAKQMLHHIVLEEWATDSMQNVLLSLIQFGVWIQEWHNQLLDVRATCEDDSEPNLYLPRNLIIVTHEFKRRRFLELHLPAIQEIWTGGISHTLECMVEDAQVIDCFPITNDRQKAEEIERGEESHGRRPWKEDPYAQGVFLSEKRTERGWSEDAFLQAATKWYPREEDVVHITQMIRS